MAYGFEEGFEYGVTPLISTGKGAFTSKPFDTGNRMLFPGPRQLMSDNYRIAPYRGGGICRVDFTKSSADAYLQADAAFDVTGTSTMFFRMMCLCYGINLSTETDTFEIFRGVSTDPNVYAGKVTWHEPEGLVLALQSQTAAIPSDEWFCVEGEVKAGAGGHVKLYIEGGSTLVHAPATVAPITEFRLGVMAQAGTITQGSMCFDEVYAHTARLFPPQGPRDAMSLAGAPLRMRKSGFAFVGSGEVLSVQLTAEAGTDNKVYIYDTATPSFSEDDLVEVLTATTAGLTKINQRILRFERGAWAQISGTDPLVLMQLGKLGGGDYYSDFASGTIDTAEETVDAT